MDSFWKWLIFGTGGGPAGFWNVLDRFFLAHIAIASALTTYLGADGFTFAKTALFPAASILVGMSLAWTTRASTILQNKELQDRLFTQGRSAEDYVYSYQLAILTIIVMVAYTAIMAGGGINIEVLGDYWDQKLSTFWMFLVMSLALRECWGAVNFTNMLSLLDYRRPR